MRQANRMFLRHEGGIEQLEQRGLARTISLPQLKS